MIRYALLAVVVAIPAAASAQLTATQRLRAEQLARIQAKANAEEEARLRKSRRQMAQISCRSSNRLWDYANDTCKPR